MALPPPKKLLFTSAHPPPPVATFRTLAVPLGADGKKESLVAPGAPKDPVAVPKSYVQGWAEAVETPDALQANNSKTYIKFINVRIFLKTLKG